MKQLKSFLFSGVFIALFLILFTSFASTNAQTGDCPVLVESALRTAEQVCNGTGRDQACYGNMLVDAQAQTGFGKLAFQQPGDIVDLVALRSLKLSPMDIEQGVWGLARLELRANLSASQPKNVTLLMFGDVQVENAVQPGDSLEVQNVVGQYVNVRLTPSEKAGVIGTLPPNQTVQAIGRLQDNSWLRVKLPESEAVGWVYAPFFSSEEDVNTLAVLEARASHFEPMQAFYFSSGADDSQPCTSMPANGMLIQTPEGVGKVTLLINEVKINIGSTVFFQAEPGNVMSVTTIEGAADVEANGTKYTAYAGTTVTVPLNEDLTPAGAPNPPVPYNLDSLQNLPIGILTETVAVLPPMTSDQIEERLVTESCAACNASNSASGNESAGNNNTGANGNSCPTCPANGNGGENGNGEDPCPGQSCNAPGQGGSCPGNSCDNPGNGGNGNSGNGNGGGNGNNGGNGGGNGNNGGNGGGGD